MTPSTRTAAGGAYPRSRSLPGQDRGPRRSGHHRSHDAVDPATLLGLVAGGDHESFSRLYDATVGRAFGTALRVLHDAAQAEEVVQEAYLQLWRFSMRFDPTRGSATTWILTIVHRQAVSRVRAVESRTSREARFHHRYGPPTGSLDETYDAAQAGLAAERVHQALATLSTAQRDAIELAYFGALTYAEVADRLDLPVGTVKSRIRSGLHQLRVQMDPPATAPG